MQKPEYKSPTLREVARLAGVSMSTASRALAGGSASQKTRSRVEEAAEKLGFYPNAIARQLSTGRTNTVAIVLAESPEFIFRDQFLSSLLGLLAVSLNAKGLLGVLVLANPADPSAFQDFIKRTGADGVIMASYHPSKVLSDAIRSLTVPVLFVGRSPAELDYCPYVDVDNYRGGYDAGIHLIETGRTHLAQIEGPAEMIAPTDRAAGFLTACRERGVVPLGKAVGDFSVEHGHRAMIDLLKRHPQIDGIFAHADQVAAGAIQALAEIGKKVPQDVAIVGFDDFDTATATNPKLTTMAQPLSKMATAAAEMMKSFLDTGEHEISEQLFRAKLVIRASA